LRHQDLSGYCQWLFEQADSRISKKYPGATVLAEKPSSLGKELNKLVRAQILRELESAATDRKTFVQSQAIRGLSFRISWARPSVLRATAVIDPYQMAQAHQALYGN
jgi:hypothetical protein